MSDTAEGMGGGLFISDTWPLTLTNNFLGANRANDQGSELWLANTQVSTETATLLHTTFGGLGLGIKLDAREERRRIRLGLEPGSGLNTAGQGIYLGSFVTTTLTNTIIAGYDEAGLYAGSGSSVRLRATLWHDNAQDVTGPGTVVREGDIYGDPAFVDAAAWDYHLGVGSAAVDQGVDAGVVVDIDGDVRPFGLGYDIGADEYVSEEEPIAGLEATNDSPTAIGLVTTLTATVESGTNVTYTWALGDGAVGSGEVVSHTYAAVGHYTAVVTAENTHNVLTATTSVTITDEPVEGLEATNDSPTLLGGATTLTATISAGTGVSYTWAYGDGEMSSGEVVSHVYPAAGYYTAVVTASNTANVMTATTPITIEAPVAPGSVTLSGPVQGYVDRPGRTRATVLPLTATLPITYWWEATGQVPVVHMGGLSDEVSYTWSVTGTKQITVTAGNAVGQVSAVHTVTILPQQVHVRDIAVSYRELEPGKYQAQSVVRIASQGNKPVAGAVVSIEWTLPNGKRIPQTATTNLSGVSRFQISRTQAGVYQICVMGVVKTGWEYDSDANVETCDTIVVPSGLLGPESPAVVLSGPEERGVGSGGSVITYTLTLTNEGRGTDQFLLAVSGNRWSVSLVQDDTGPLEAGASVQVTAVVTVPLEMVELATGQDTCAVTATSLWADAVSDTVWLVTEWDSPHAATTLGPWRSRRPS